MADYSVPNAFRPDAMGTWSFICTVYDRPSGNVCHYIDGKQVKKHAIELDMPLSIGAAEIGNWGAPVFTEEASPIRNFNGCIDELTIWDGVLSPAEVRTAYDQGRP